mmetsp:Transcript_20343/g.48281  ORF Transcript_20343/g.48281 Transcript_20343/m.48281 type:complete len:321 (+) Transcript_20343:509-1471(+)
MESEQLIKDRTFTAPLPTFARHAHFGRSSSSEMSTSKIGSAVGSVAVKPGTDFMVARINSSFFSSRSWDVFCLDLPAVMFRLNTSFSARRRTLESILGGGWLSSLPELEGSQCSSRGGPNAGAKPLLSKSDMLLRLRLFVEPCMVKSMSLDSTAFCGIAPGGSMPSLSLLMLRLLCARGWSGGSTGAWLLGSWITWLSTAAGTTGRTAAASDGLSSLFSNFLEPWRRKNMLSEQVPASLPNNPQPLLGARCRKSSLANFISRSFMPIFSSLPWWWECPPHFGSPEIDTSSIEDFWLFITEWIAGKSRFSMSSSDACGAYP